MKAKHLFVLHVLIKLLKSFVHIPCLLYICVFKYLCIFGLSDICILNIFVFLKSPVYWKQSCGWEVLLAWYIRCSTTFSFSAVCSEKYHILYTLEQRGKRCELYAVWYLCPFSLGYSIEWSLFLLGQHISRVFVFLAMPRGSMQDLSSPPGTKLVIPEVEAWSLKHWIAGKVT